MERTLATRKSAAAICTRAAHAQCSLQEQADWRWKFAIWGYLRAGGLLRTQIARVLVSKLILMWNSTSTSRDAVVGKNTCLE